MEQFKLALIQMHCEFGQVEKNLEKAEGMIRTAAAQGASLVCLPETFNTGHFGEMDRFLSLAEPPHRPTLWRLQTLVQSLGIHLLAPLLTRAQDGGCENTAFLIDPDGEIIGSYAKTHPVGDERATLRRGNQYPVFDTPLGKIGVCICYDACFPEVLRLLALGGAELILIPAAWRASHYYKEWWDTVLPCRAIDNLCYIAAVNQTGPTGFGDELYAGKSQIINPVGMRLATLGTDEEGILCLPIYPGRVAQERTTNTLLIDRHPEDYPPVSSRYIPHT